MKIELYDVKGKKSAKKIELNESVWAVPFNADIVSQGILTYRHNQTKGTAQAKTRGEISGGGKKPWNQKGTGRARQGSIRSPIWVGGGIVFGPRSYKRLSCFPKKMAQKALAVALSQCLREGQVRIVESFSSLADGKTKQMKDLLTKLGVDQDKLLILVDMAEKEREQVVRTSKNLARVRYQPASDVNVYHVADAKTILLSQASVAAIEQRLAVHNVSK